MAAGRPSTPGIVVYHLPIKRLPGARTDKYAADRKMRAPNQAGENIMLKRAALLGFLAMLVVGNLPGSAEAWWGGGCYRSPCYPRYYRPYYPRYYGGWILWRVRWLRWLLPWLRRVWRLRSWWVRRLRRLRRVRWRGPGGRVGRGGGY